MKKIRTLKEISGGRFEAERALAGLGSATGSWVVMASALTYCYNSY